MSSSPQQQMQLTLFSFGFKYGPPSEATLLFDVRFLPNPYWVEELRPQTGRTQAVADYVLTSEVGVAFLAHLEPMLRFLVQQNIAAGKEEIQLAIGCTGGRHRSVAVVEQLNVLLAELPVELTTFHRDIDKDGKTKPQG